jgi:hypothetical protein
MTLLLRHSAHGHFKGMSRAVPLSRRGVGREVASLSATPPLPDALFYDASSTSNARANTRSHRTPQGDACANARELCTTDDPLMDDSWGTSSPEVLCALRSVCSSQEDARARTLGTGFGDRLRVSRDTAVSLRGNKKGHLLAFSRAL